MAHNFKTIVENIDTKVVLWVGLSLVASILSCVIYGITTKLKKQRDAKKFSDPRYAIGAAIVNMERAAMYDDGENFRFFARYAIRTCLGMPKSYPPDEPSAEAISQELSKKCIDGDLSKKIMDVYRLESLPEDTEKWMEGVRNVIGNLFENCQTKDENLGEGL